MYYKYMNEEIVPQNKIKVKDMVIDVERKIDMDMLFNDYVNGSDEIFEKVLNEVGYDEFLESYQFVLENSLDLMTQLYNHQLYQRAEWIAKQDNEYLDYDFWYNDIFADCNLKSYQLIQDLIDTAWTEVTSEEYFKQIVGELDEELLKVLSRIY